MIVANLSTTDVHSVSEYYDVYGGTSVTDRVTGRTLLILIDKHTKWSLVETIIDLTQREFISCELVLLDAQTDVPKLTTNLYTLARVKPKYLTQYFKRKSGNKDE